MTSEDAAVHEEMMLAANESASFARQAKPMLSAEMLSQLDADVVRFATDYLLSRPYAMIRPLANFRRDVFSLIDGHPKVTALPRLYAAAGRASALLALASSDLGQADSADAHARTAWLCTDLAEEDRDRPFIRWVQSQVAYWRRDYRAAADLAESGIQYSASPSSRLRLMSQQARAVAALMDEQSAAATLNIAADVRDSFDDQVQEDPGVFLFSSGKAAYYASEAWLSLGGKVNISRAAEEARESIALFNAHDRGRSDEQIAAARIDLALAEMGLGELDASVDSLRPVIELHSERRTLPIVKRMSNLRGELQGSTYAETRIASELIEEIDVFTAYPATRDLPVSIG